MHRKKLIISILTILGLALGALGLWLLELHIRIGADSFSWLWSRQSSIFGILVLTVSAYLIPVGILQKISWKKLWLPGLELYFVGIIAFFLTKSILYSLFLPYSVFDLPPLVLWLMLGVLAMTSSSSFFYLTHNYLYPLKRAFIPLMLAVEFLAGMLSVLLTYIFLAQGPLDQILMAAVRTGLPFFFITLLLGLLSIVSIRKLSVTREEEHEDEQQDEILDDMMMK